MITAVISLPTSLPEYLSDLEAACKNEAELVENADRQTLAGRFNLLQDQAAKRELDATDSRQIVAAMRRIIGTHPPKWITFEAKRLLWAIRSTQWP